MNDFVKFPLILKSAIGNNFSFKPGGKEISKCGEYDHCCRFD